MHPADKTPQALPLKRLRMNAGGGDPGEEAPLYIQSCTLQFIALLLGSIYIDHSQCRITLVLHSAMAIPMFCIGELVIKTHKTHILDLESYNRTYKSHVKPACPCPVFMLQICNDVA